MKILIANGPNLNRLSERDTQFYGGKDWNEIQDLLRKEFPHVDFDFFQADSEEQIVSKFAQTNNKYTGIVFNPGAFSHYSIAIRDSIELLKIPIVEVHLSNISDRDTFRKTLITASKSSGYISGFKQNSYLAAVYVLTKMS